MRCKPIMVLVLFGWFGLLSATSVSAQEESYPVTAINLTDWYGELFFESRYQANTENRSSASSDETDLYIEAGIRLNLEGYIYHPNLLEYTANLMFGLTKQDIDVNGESLDNEGTLLGYHINGLLFKTKPVSLRLYANKTQQFIDRSFTRNVDLDTEVFGLEITTKGDVPMTLTVEQRQIIEENIQRSDDEDTLYISFEVEDRRDPDWYTEFLYEHEDTDETSTTFPVSGSPFTQDLPDLRDEVNIHNQWLFGPKELQHQLDGNTRIMKREGFFNNDVVHLRQRLVLNHTEDFLTFYNGNYLNSKTDNQEEESIRMEAGLTKQFYDSLSVTLKGFGDNSDFDNGYDRLYGGAINTDYRKDTPWGLLTSSFDFEKRYEEESFEGGIRTILDEAVTLTGINWIALNQANVIPGSIVVTDVTNTVFYIQGLDYNLRTTGSITEIQRIPGANIADGQTVFVDYQADAGEDSKFTTDLFRSRTRYEFSDLPLAVYFEYRLRDEQLESGTDPGNLDKWQVWIAGVEITFGDAMLTLEHEDQDLELGPPFTADRARLIYNRRYNDWVFNASAEYEMLKYSQAEQFGLVDGEDFVETYGFTFDMTTRFTQNTLFRLESLYRNRTGRDEDSIMRVGASLNWNYAQTELSIGGFHEIWEQENDDGTRDYINIRITRRF